MEGIWNEFEEAAVKQMMTYTFIGSPHTMKNNLQHFLNETQADELMIVSHIHDQEARKHSCEIVATERSSG